MKMKNPSIRVMWLLLAAISSAGAASAQSAAHGETTAWHDSRFNIDVPGVIGRSDIVLGQPNQTAGQAMPLGNGRLGVAVWSEDGLTVQLNRADTLPDRLSPGQVIVPGLSALTGAKDYAGRLDLYNGEFIEHGGGMAAKIYVEPATDTLVIDVSGANRGKQTAQLKLWEPRTTHAFVSGKIGLLSQSWIDKKNPGASRRAFGSLSAITAEGCGVSVAVASPLAVTVSFSPDADGHFRILVAAPRYNGTQYPLSTVRSALAAASPSAHRSWWHAYWNRAATIKVNSQDGAGEYMENLRNIYLFAAAAEKGVEYPGSQAGVADMFSSARDAHRWDSSAFWHWNLRMQVAANIGAGLPDLNAPYFNFYRENISNLEEWTKKYMGGRAGICVAETMRFNGQGIEYESSWNPISIAHDCDLSFHPYYNARTLSTGAEVGLWVWQQYLTTNDHSFLAANYPLMAEAARFLLAYQKSGPDDLLHTQPSNAHETQWDVRDPTTDIAAAKALYPATIDAAKLLGKDADLIRQMQAALPKVPPFPRTEETGSRTLLSPAADADSQDVIAESYLPGAQNHNGENIGLEPVWPYDVIGDTSPLFSLARRTYDHRLFAAVADWSFDPIQAARLHLGSEVGSTLIRVTEHSQHTPNGFANWDARYGEFYVEETGIVADALQEALAQDYDGLIRIAPAIPPGWDFDGSVFVRGKTKVDVQVRNGIVTTAVIEAGATQSFKVRNPWPGKQVNVVSGKTDAVLVKASSNAVITFSGTAGTKYLLELKDAPITNERFAPVSGEPATSAKRLGGVQIGLFPDDQ